MERVITAQDLEVFEQHLRDEEKSRSTLQYYLRNVQRFMEWLDGRPVSKEEAIAHKEKLKAEHYKPSSINTMLAAINVFFLFMGWRDCHVKSLQEQQKSYCLEDEELEPEEFERLVEQAEREHKEQRFIFPANIRTTKASRQIPYLTGGFLKTWIQMIHNSWRGVGRLF